MSEFETIVLPAEVVAIAPDGSEVRPLIRLARGSLAHFTLGPKEVSEAATHRNVEEMWFFLTGRGRMWRKQEGVEQTVDVYPGVAISIPTGTHFQFRSDTEEALSAVGTTMPPWPLDRDDEAIRVEGTWAPTVKGSWPNSKET